MRIFQLALVAATLLTATLETNAQREFTRADTYELCGEAKLGSFSAEHCEVTDAKTNESYSQTKICVGTELGVSVSAGSLSAGASGGHKVCTTYTSKKSRAKPQREFTRADMR